MNQVFNINRERVCSPYFHPCIEENPFQTHSVYMPTCESVNGKCVAQEGEQSSSIRTQNGSKKMEETEVQFQTSLIEKIQESRDQKSLGGVKSIGLTSSQIKPPPETCLPFHRNYLIKRLQETHYAISGPQLFKEIHAKGYRGSVGTVSNWASVIRRDQGFSQARLSAHKVYLRKRVEETRSHWISSAALFREISAKGYRGSVKTVQKFVAALRGHDHVPEAYVDFYHDYLTKKLEESRSCEVSAKKLFKDMRIRGYRGSLSSVRRKLTMIRREFLFRKVRDQGYRGALQAVRDSVSSTHRDQSPPEAHLSFHKDYLKKRVKAVGPQSVSVSKLWSEIQVRGYRGSFQAVKGFVSLIRDDERDPKACISFYRDYLVKRVEETRPHYVSAAQLFRDIREQGYQGSIANVRRFVASIREGEQCSILGPYQDYL